MPDAKLPPKKWKGKKSYFGAKTLNVELNMRFYGHFLGKSRLTKNRKMISGVGGDQNCRTDFEISVIIPVFHR